ncbi:MAG: HpcH/HpaI aldolase/citrate lyase family protein [Spirochaetales bacterium]|nr:HpcH/HpaI aldolase/citrate lyase family protein [Spirochaetales bacterium]
MGNLRRTMLYVPGSNAGMVKDANIYRSDSIMFDLEDSVSMKEKDTARFLIFNALRTLDYEGTETVVRINGLDTPFGKDDIRAMVRARPDIIRLPKTESPKDVEDVEALVLAEERKNGYEEGTIKLMAAIESPLGVINAYPIACASRRLIGIAIGAEDFVTAMKTKRSPEGTELLFARSRILIAARAAGINALDTVFSDVNDEEGLIRETEHIKQLGFDGKSIISPRQIAPIHRIFSPKEEEVVFAKRVAEAIKRAEAEGSGVISLDGKMVDKPIVERAYRVLDLASASGAYK